MFNPPSVVRWNCNKKYLLDLQKKGVPIVPTVIINKTDLPRIRSLVPNNWSTLIVKPTVGASGFGVIKIEEKDSSSKDIESLSFNEVLVQPLIKEIENGEYSFIYIGKNLSHVVLKIPASGDYRTNYKHGGKEELVRPDKGIAKQVENIIEKVNLPFLYARVDGVIVRRQFLLMELELIEPYLFMCQHPPSANLFAKQIASLLK